MDELLEARLALDAWDVPYEVFNENTFLLNPRSIRGSVLEIRVPRNRLGEAADAVREGRSG
jgi:hypothetical protein